ncbi:MAG: hypothetical protein IPG97_04395 [Microthrixaceae bacterium]|nr:hypothetical protein [Microthrixaceae bacterium]
MRVLDLVKGLDRGGAETLLLTGARHRYPAITSEIAYLSSRHDQLVDELTAEGVKVTCLAPGSMVDPRWLWRLRRA